MAIVDLPTLIKTLCQHPKETEWLEFKQNKFVPQEVGVSDWLLEVHAPFWPVSFRHPKRTVDLAGFSHTLHQRVAFAPARVCFWRCGPCCYRQVGRNDLLWLAGPTHAADTGAALLDGDETTVRTAAASDSTPFIRISKRRADRNKHRCGGHDNDSKNDFVHEGHPNSDAKRSIESYLIPPELARPAIIIRAG